MINSRCEEAGEATLQLHCSDSDGHTVCAKQETHSVRDIPVSPGKVETKTFCSVNFHLKNFSKSFHFSAVPTKAGKTLCVTICPSTNVSSSCQRLWGGREKVITGLLTPPRSTCLRRDPSGEVQLIVEREHRTEVWFVQEATQGVQEESHEAGLPWGCRVLRPLHHHPGASSPSSEASLRSCLTCGHQLTVRYDILPASLLKVIMILVVPMLLWLVVVVVMRLWWFANNKTPVKGVTYDI